MKVGQEIVKYPLDIVGQNVVQVKKDVIIIMSKKTSNSIDQKRQMSCKILKFSSDWNFDETLSTISRLELQNYPNLFIFIIEVENFGFLESIEEKLPEKVKILQENLVKFNKTRPMVLQLTSKDENFTKFYYKDENCEEIQEVKKPDEELTDFDDFPTFLWLYLRGKIENFQNKMLKKLPNVENSSIILKFLKTLNLSEKFFKRLILKCSAEGSMSDFLAAIDIRIEKNGEIQESKLKYFSDHSCRFIQIFKTALVSGNQEVKEFLMKFFNKLIRKLPFHDKFGISSTAYENNKIEDLCDLLEFWDFPFPRYFCSNVIVDERLLKIIKERVKFYEDVNAENLPEIEKFLQNSPNLKFVYNLKNQSAFSHALESKKFKSFSHLINISYQNLNERDVKDLTKNGKNMSLIISSTLEIHELEDLIDKIKNKTDSKFISETLKMRNSNENLFFSLVRSGCTNMQKFKWLLKFMEKFLGSSEIIKLVTCVNNNGHNILHFCVKHENTRQLSILFRIFKNYFDSLNLSKKFKDLLTQKHPRSQENILYHSTNWKTKESHQTLWRLLLNTFENREELKDLIIETIKYGNNYVHLLLDYNEPEMLDFVIRKIKENFNNDQYSQILKSKGRLDRNLLQIAANKFDDVNQFQSVWKSFLEYLNSMEIFDMIMHVDNNEDNVLTNTIRFKSIDICDFIFDEIIKILDLNKENNPEMLNKLKNLIECNLKDGIKTAHFLIGYDESDLIELIFKKLKEILTEDQYEEIIKSKGYCGRNLIQHAACYTEDIKMHQTLWKIIRDFYKPDAEFLEFLKKIDDDGDNVFHIAAIFSSKEIFEFMINELEKIASNLEIRNILRSTNKSLLQSAAKEKKSAELHEYLWKTIRCYCEKSEIVNMIRQIEESGNNLLVTAASSNTKEVVKLTWDEIKSTFGQDNYSEFKNYIKYVNNDGENCLHALSSRKEEVNDDDDSDEDDADSEYTVEDSEESDGDNDVQNYDKNCKLIEIHKTMWELLVNTFENSDELKDLIMQKDKNKNNFLHILMHHESHKIIEFTFKKIKEIFIEDKFCEILKSKLGNWDRNLLQAAACDSVNVKMHQVLWKIFCDFYKSDNKFLEFLKEVDNQHNNVFHLAASFTSKEIFGFMMNQLEKIASNEEIKNILRSTDKSLLQSAALQNESVELHEYLWTIMRKYFNPTEILDMIKHTDEFGYNILLNASELNTKYILELTWTEIKFIFDATGNALIIPQYLSCIKNNHENVLHKLMISGDSENLKYFWSELENYFTKQQLRDLLCQGALEVEKNVLQYATTVDQLEFLEILWEVLLKNFENREDLKDLIMQNDKDEDNYVHCLVTNNKPEIIEFSIRKIKENFSNDQYEQILKSKGQFGRNLLQTATCGSKDIRKHQTLWKIFKDCYKSDSKFIEFLKEVDNENNNIFHLAAASTSAEIFDFMIKELDKIASNEQIRIILRTLREESQNLLQSAVINNKSFELHQKLWKVIQMYLNPSEILDMINNADGNGDNVLLYAVKYYTKEIFELIWMEVTNLITNIENKDTSLKDYLKCTNNDGQNVLDCAAKIDFIEFHETLWRLLVNTFENQEDLKDLILQNNKYGCNYVHCLVIHNKSEIIKFTFEELKQNLSNDQYSQILRSKGQFGRNSLHQAACYTEDIKTHQTLWNINQNFYKSNDEFINFLKEVDDDDDNIFHIAAAFLSKEIFEFMMTQLEQTETKEEIRNILRTLGSEKNNLLQLAAKHQKSVEFHEYLWKTIRFYFSNSEIVDMLKHNDEFKNNLLFIAARYSAKEVFGMTWDVIKRTFGQDNYAEFINYVNYVNNDGESYLHALLSRKTEVNHGDDETDDDGADSYHTVEDSGDEEDN